MGEEREGLTFDQIRELREHSAGPVYASLETGRRCTEKQYAAELAEIVQENTNEFWPAHAFDPKHPTAHTGLNLRALLGRYGHTRWTANKLAEVAGIPEDSAKSYLNGRRAPTLRAFARIADTIAEREYERLCAEAVEEDLGEFPFVSEVRLLAVRQLIGTERAVDDAQAELRAANKRRVARSYYLAMQAAILREEDLETLIYLAQRMGGAELMPKTIYTPTERKVESEEEFTAYDVLLNLIDEENCCPETIWDETDEVEVGYRDYHNQQTEEDKRALGGISAIEFLERVQSALDGNDAQAMREYYDSLFFTVCNMPRVVTPLMGADLWGSVFPDGDVRLHIRG